MPGKCCQQRCWWSWSVKHRLNAAAAASVTSMPYRVAYYATDSSSLLQSEYRTRRPSLNSATVWLSAQKFCARWTWSNFAHAPASCASTPADVMAWPSEFVQLKFDQYAAHPPISCASCRMWWWGEHKTSYQILSSVALCIPATSVASVHVFLNHDVITRKIFTLVLSKTETVIFLMDNMWLLHRC